MMRLSKIKDSLQVKLLLLALLVLIENSHCKEEDPRKCGYCIATAEVLSKRLQKEKPRNHLDYRGRLDGDGVRFGKILDFRLSELRIIELLENLSEDLEPYTEVILAENGPIRWQNRDHLTGNKTATDEFEVKHYRRFLKRWCEQIVEQQEDAITSYLRSDNVTPAEARAEL